MTAQQEREETTTSRTEKSRTVFEKTGAFKENSSCFRQKLPAIYQLLQPIHSFRGSPAKESDPSEHYSSFDTQQAYVEQQCHHTSKAPIT